MSGRQDTEHRIQTGRRTRLYPAPRSELTPAAGKAAPPPPRQGQRHHRGGRCTAAAHSNCLEGVPSGRKAADSQPLAPSPTTFGALDGDDVAAAGDIDFSKPSIVTVTLSDGNVITLTGAAIGDKRWIQVARQKDAALERQRRTAAHSRLPLTATTRYSSHWNNCWYRNRRERQTRGGERETRCAGRETRSAGHSPPASAKKPTPRPNRDQRRRPPASGAGWRRWCTTRYC